MTNNEAWKQSIKSTVKINNAEERIAKAEADAERAAYNANRILGNHQKKQTVGMILWYCRKLDIDAAAFATHLRLKKYLYGNDIERLINMEKVLKEMLVQKSKK